MENELTRETAALFEQLKHTTKSGVEYWSAREIYPHLGYTQWRNFQNAIEKAKEACKSATGNTREHFADVSKTIAMPKGASKEIDDVLLTRYACYLVAQDIHKRKGLKKSQKILDHMGSTELAANLFRATQTEEKLKRENITGKANANRTHFSVGAKVRQTIKELGGTMPEDLPAAESIKSVESRQRKLINQDSEENQ